MSEPKYRTKGFMERATALYDAARRATRYTAGEGGDSAIRPIESVTAVRRAQPLTVRSLDDTDIKA